MNTVHATLSTEHFEDVLKTLTSLLAEEIWTRVLIPHQFDSAGAVQFQCDCWCLFSVFKPYSRKPENLFKR